MTTRTKCEENIKKLQARLLEIERRLVELHGEIEEGQSGVVLSVANYVADQGEEMMRIKEDV